MPLTLAAGVVANVSVSSMPSSSRAEQREQRPLLGVVGAGRVAERGPDPAVALGDQLLARELLAGRVPLAPRPLVELLGEGLGEPVGERLDHDRAVVVVLGLVARRELVGAVDRRPRTRRCGRPSGAT